MAISVKKTLYTSLIQLPKTLLYVCIKYCLFILHSIQAYGMSCTEITIHTHNTNSYHIALYMSKMQPLDMPSIHTYHRVSIASQGL
jgi:hypothetical protein